MKNIILIILRVLLGGVFVFSGFVKAIDPLGFTYKIQDYLIAMGDFFTQFSSLALVVAVLLVSLELAIGLCLVFGVRVKEATVAAAVLMLFMTPLTLWLAITNAVHDCSCFGEALIITNWETFWKNIAIIVVIILIFILLKYQKSSLRCRIQWILAAYSFLFAVGLSLYCYTSLPLIDFRPYKIGDNIQENMQLPDDAVRDSSVFSFIYAKNGVEKEFTLENYPAGDSTWTYVDTKETVIRKGDVPKITDLQFYLDGAEAQDLVLENEGYTFLLVTHNIDKADLSPSESINDIYCYATANGYDFYAVTNSDSDAIARYRQQTQAEYPILWGDDILLKTIVRSNPGLLLLKDATVVNKWHAGNIPVFDMPLDQSEEAQLVLQSTVQTIVIVTLMYLIPFLIILIIGKILTNKRD